MKRTALAVLFTCLVLLTGCSPMVPDPLEKATTTLVPGTNTQIHSPIAQQETGDTYNAVLYFRFMQEDLLAQESRKIHVSMDQSLEKSLVAALMQGPGASSPELRRLFSGQVAVISTLSQGNTLFVTLSESVLLEPMEDRFLQMQSLAATLCENCGYESVQVLVDKKSAPTTSLRLSSSFFDPEQDGAAPPLTRDESFILGPYRTGETILGAWQKKDFERLYSFLAVENPSTSSVRPPLQTALTELDGGYSLMDFTLGKGTVFPDGSQAVLSADMTLLQGNADKLTIRQYPLTLVRENGVWKLRYEDLIKLINRQ